MNIVLFRDDSFTKLEDLENGKTYYIQAVYGNDDRPIVLASSDIRPARIEEGFLGSDFKVTKKEGKDIWVAARFSPVNVHIEEIAVAGGGGETINNQDVEVIPSTVTQQITADEGYTGIGTVTVNAVTAAIDANIQAKNIKKDVTILGVTGTLEGGSSDIDYDTWSSYLIKSADDAIQKKDTAFAYGTWDSVHMSPLSFQNVRLLFTKLSIYSNNFSLPLVEDLNQQIQIEDLTQEGIIEINLPMVNNISAAQAFQCSYSNRLSINLNSFTNGSMSSQPFYWVNATELVINMPELKVLRGSEFFGYIDSIENIVFNAPKLEELSNTHWTGTSGNIWDRVSNIDSILNNLKRINASSSFEYYNKPTLNLNNVVSLNNSSIFRNATSVNVINMRKVTDLNRYALRDCRAAEIHFSAENKATIESLAGYSTLFGANASITTIYFDSDNGIPNDDTRTPVDDIIE